MVLRPPRATLTYTLVPDTTLFRSAAPSRRAHRGVAHLCPAAGCCSLRRAHGAAGRTFAHRADACGFVQRIEHQRGTPRRSCPDRRPDRSEEQTSELQSLMRISYAGFHLKKKIKKQKIIRQLK